MQKRLAIYLIIILCFPFGFSIRAQNTPTNPFNCYSIVAGRAASKSGAVLFAHNEDDWGERVVNALVVAAEKHSPGEKIALKTGHKIAQVSHTHKYIWLEMPEMEFSDSYFNEFGLCIGSNQCRSREDQKDYTAGGIGYWLRRILAERATSARQAVQIAGKLIEKYGYHSSGRSYTIADPNEAWLLSVVQGRHWVAARIPDDAVMIISNYYVIKTVDLSDSLNYLGSKDLISYAIERNWYNPEKDGPFNFREVYSAPDNLMNDENIARKWRALNILQDTLYDYHADFPFCFQPKRKIDRNDLFSVLRDHYEGSFLDETKGSGYQTISPHENKVMPICSNTNQYGFVAELRNWLPADVGCILWLASRRPCSQAFIPWYCGIQQLPYPAPFSKEKVLKNHFHPTTEFINQSNNLKQYGFPVNLLQLDSNYQHLHKPLFEKIQDFDNQLHLNQNVFENQINKIPLKQQTTRSQMLDEYFHSIVLKLSNN